MLILFVTPRFYVYNKFKIITSMIFHSNRIVHVVYGGANTPFYGFMSAVLTDMLAQENMWSVMLWITRHAYKWYPRSNSSYLRGHVITLTPNT